MTETNRSSGDRILRDPFSYHPWLKTILDSLSEGVIVTDDRGCVTYVNSEAEKLIGLRRADVIRRLIEDVYPLESTTESPVETYQIRSALSSTLPTGKQRFLLCRRDGRNILIEDSAAPLMSDGRVIGAVTVFAQVTNRLRHEHDQELEHEPHEAQMHAVTEALGQTRSELRKLSADLMAAQEDERRRIGRELHDDFGQKIALLGMELEQLARMLPLEALTKRTLERLRKQITDLSHAIRETSHRLYPSVLNDLGFAPALRQLIDGFRGSGLDVNLRIQVPHPALKLDVALALYRVVQEALRNVATHASGAAASITVTTTDAGMQLAIEDSGPGFDLESARKAGGLGLISMQERARGVGGTLLVRTAPGQGTVLVVRVPVRKLTS